MANELPKTRILVERDEPHPLGAPCVQPPELLHQLPRWNGGIEFHRPRAERVELVTALAQLVAVVATERPAILLESLAPQIDVKAACIRMDPHEVALNGVFVESEVGVRSLGHVHQPQGIP